LNSLNFLTFAGARNNKSQEEEKKKFIIVADRDSKKRKISYDMLHISEEE
jgi:hypothetical protein